MTPRPAGQLGGGGSSQNDVFGVPMTVTRQTGTGRAYRLSEALPVYAAPDQDVCGVDM